MKNKQTTIKETVEIKGKGLHTGKPVKIKFSPLDANQGIVFQRTDLNGSYVKAIADNLYETKRGTSLSENGVVVRTVEHLLAAITGLSIDNILIQLDNEEVPILDGSAYYFVETLKKCGIEYLSETKEYFTFTEELRVDDDENDAHIILKPASEYSVHCFIDYKSSIIPPQDYLMKDIKYFADEVADSRTFVFLHEIFPLIKNGLVKGGDFNNAIVFVDQIISEEEQTELANFFKVEKIKVLKQGVLNNVMLKYKNEPARHKLIDVVGDLTLVGYPFKAHIEAIRPGHKINTKFAKIIRNYIKERL